MVGGVADHDQPVTGACGPIDGAPVDVAAGHRGATGDLLLYQIEVGGPHQPGDDAVVGEGLELGVCIGGVSVALHHRHSGIRFLTPSQRHRGKAIEICRHRARVYELARQRHPLSWSGTTRCWHQPEVVWINPPPPEIGINPAKLVVAA